MADERTLLVPGTQATTLRDHRGNTVYNAVRVQLLLGRSDIGDRDPDELGKLVSMEHAPGRLKPVRTSLEDGTHIVKGDVLRIPYDGLPVTDWFRYDWRADLRFNANRLLQFLREEAEPGLRWNLIGHSQGGLLIVLASKLAKSPREFASMVGRVVLVGTPLAGTVKAVEAILFGREDMGKENLPGLLAAARTWPAIYQMLPAWRAAVDVDRSPWPDREQFIWPDGWGYLLNADHPIQADLLVRARETQALLTGPFSSLVPAVDTLTIMGASRDHMTPISVPLGDDGYIQEYTFEDGDGYVPERKTTEHIGNPTFDYRRIYTEQINDHETLCLDHDVQDLIGQFFERQLLPLPAA